LEQQIIVRIAHSGDVHYSTSITDEMASSAKARGTGIAKRSPEYVAKKIEEGKSVIAHTADGTWVGFCYIEAWQHGQFVANSGLIVAPEFRKSGIAKKIKQTIFQLSREKYPNAKLFGLTTGLAVMKINSELGYEPVTYSELTDDEEFWAGCKSCVNYEILMSKDRKNCMCTAMLYEPKLTTTTNDSSNKTTTEISLEDSTESSKGVASKLLNWFRKNKDYGESCIGF
jgi:N-acetylglutamate synthase-like GNAT family acetyltransferase